MLGINNSMNAGISSEMKLPLFKRILQMREFILLVIVFAQFLVLSIISPYFLTEENIIAVVFGFSLDAIIAVGMTFVIACGEFDMSVGSTLALTGVIVAKMLLGGVPTVIAILLGGIFLGILIGLVNGLIVTKVGINSFITTLGMQGIVRGISLIITQGYPISKLPQDFTAIGQGYVGKIPYTFFIMFFIIILGEFLLRKVRYFRQTYYIGGNLTAAKYSGINVDRVKIAMFMIIGMLSGIAGALQTARLGSAMSTAGQSAELRAISAVVIGGAALSGGEGSVLGTFLGVILLAFVVNALVLLNVSIYWQSVVSGIVLLVAVAIDILAKKSSLSDGGKKKA